MRREATDDVIPEGMTPVDMMDPEQLFNRRHRMFMETMEAIYGPDVQKRLSKSELIARHREVAESLLVVKRRAPRKDDFFAKPKTVIMN